MQSFKVRRRTRAQLKRRLVSITALRRRAYSPEEGGKENSGGGGGGATCLQSKQPEIF